MTTKHRYNQQDPEARQLFMQLDSFRAQIAGWQRAIADAEQNKLRPHDHQTVVKMDALITQWQGNIEAAQRNVDKLVAQLQNMGEVVS